jgi:hypothetical protein
MHRTTAITSAYRGPGFMISKELFTMCETSRRQPVDPQVKARLATASF